MKLLKHEKKVGMYVKEVAGTEYVVDQKGTMHRVKKKVPKKGRGSKVK